MDSIQYCLFRAWQVFKEGAAAKRREGQKIRDYVRLRANDGTTTTTKGGVVDSSTISLQVLDKAMDKKESRKSDVSGGDEVPEMQSMQGKQRSSAPLTSPRGSSDRKSGQRSSEHIPRSRQGSSYISDIGSNTAPLTKALSVMNGRLKC